MADNRTAEELWQQLEQERQQREQERQQERQQREQERQQERQQLLQQLAQTLADIAGVQERIVALEQQEAPDHVDLSWFRRYLASHEQTRARIEGMIEGLIAREGDVPDPLGREVPGGDGESNAESSISSSAVASFPGSGTASADRAGGGTGAEGVDRGIFDEVSENNP
jgi:multidrug efflux pump subunit AcrA (membrane-fusion protein)